nr:leucine-rich repeat-containing protein 4C-like [Leptinotarsa decemlineata]
MTKLRVVGIYLIIIVLTSIKFGYSEEKCNSFDNVFVQLVDKDDVEFNQTVNGCLERIEFGERTVKFAYIRNQKVPVLGKDSVRNMVQLLTVSFWGCELDILEPFAFRNVPRLKNVQISYCNLKEIPKNVFNHIPSIEQLRFHNNQIDFIENQAFANLSALKKVFGSDNNLEYWNREWFDASPNLEVMDFQQNKIRTIPRKAFAALPKLKQIFFDYNEISAIQPDAFEGLTYLEYLGLRNNRLKVLNEDIFPNDIKIKRLLLSANYLNFISNEVLKKMFVEGVLLYHNPWKCPCFDRINYWLYTTKGTSDKDHTCEVDFIPICAYPNLYSQSCLEYVDDELTQRYLNSFRASSTDKHKYCARLD